MAQRHLSERARKFLREVGSIVLGVLIALAIGEVADNIRWRISISNSMRAITQEMSGNRFNVAERLTYQACITRRLAEVGSILTEARTTKTLPEVRNLGAPGVRPTEQYAYEVFRSEGAPLHMRREQAREIASVYNVFAVYVTATDKELDYWNTLSLLEHAKGPVSDDLLASLLQAWSGATAQAAFIGLVATQANAKLAKSHIPIEFGASGPDLPSLMSTSRKRTICRTMLADGRPVGLSTRQN